MVMSLGKHLHVQGILMTWVEMEILTYLIISLNLFSLASQMKFPSLTFLHQVMSLLLPQTL
jgi:hypothetical protein